MHYLYGKILHHLHYPDGNMLIDKLNHAQQYDYRVMDEMQLAMYV